MGPDRAASNPGVPQASHVIIYTTDVQWAGPWFSLHACVNRHQRWTDVNHLTSTLLSTQAHRM
jgi:hypothetical protein